MTLATMTMVQAIRSAHDVALARDGNVVIFGEDVGYFGGVFRCTEGQQAKYGDSRVFDTPIAEGGIVGIAVGMSAYGLTISLTKDLMILNQALLYKPDLLVWLTTLEAFPKTKQLDSPIVANNAKSVQELIANYQLLADPNDPALNQPSKQEQAFVRHTASPWGRRWVADLIRLQIYGVLWSSTGIDQIYPEDYERAQIDLEAGADFHGLTSLQNVLALDVLKTGMATSIPTLLVNEPIRRNMHCYWPVEARAGGELWNRFYVTARGERVLVETAGGKLVTLEDWRAQAGASGAPHTPVRGG